MHTVGDVLLFALGVVIVVIVLDGAIRTFVVPRATVVTFTVSVFRSVRWVFRLLARPSRGYEAQDRVLALYAPITLLTLPTVSILFIWLGYAFMFEAVQHESWREAFIMSGSSLLTLGFDRPSGFPATLLSFSEAAIGLGLLALLIAYL